ncbi:MAG: FHA domain-containing protein [Acidobacteria bacterium]|nr:FHA domain-containing protein [Acidobacteriota bacterium]
MAKLYLKFEDRVIREIVLSGGEVTIGRQPDNLVCIDNPAVSGHHAKVYGEDDHYILEDKESFNGTYVNNHRISRVTLKDGDEALIGKHTIEFRDQGIEAASAPRSALVHSPARQSQVEKANAPQLDCTVVLDTAKAKELLARAAVAASIAGSVGQQNSGTSQNRPHDDGPGVRQTVGTLTIVKGRTDQQYYVLTSKLTVIGKSKMAGIRLKKWFAPRVVASIHRAEDSYFIAPSGNKIKIRVNNSLIGSGQTQLKVGDIIEVAEIKAVFHICER